MTRIREFKETKEVINHDIETLDLGEEMEFAKLENAEISIEPYVDLWKMVKNFENYNSSWVKTPVFKLDPELIDK